MKIVSWNCNGALRKKWHALVALDADVFIIQECEDPARSNDAKYLEWSGNYLWTGTSKSKGIGVFVRAHIHLEIVKLDLAPLELFLPCRLNGAPLLATWTKSANSPTFGYIGQLWKFLQTYKIFLDDQRALVIGDLNSNVEWDKWDRWWNHSDVVRELGDLGLKSAYHDFLGINQGNEPDPTFYLHRKMNKPYHIDYAFMGGAWNVDSLHVLKVADWIELSDHMPLVIKANVIP
jgi:exonuclease III